MFGPIPAMSETLRNEALIPGIDHGRRLGIQSPGAPVCPPEHLQRGFRTDSATSSSSTHEQPSDDRITSTAAPSSAAA